MQTRIVVWFVALALSLMQIWCGSNCSRISSSNFQSHARKKSTYAGSGDIADDLEKEGKMWPWAHKQQQQPQTNLIIITRPTASNFNAPITTLPVVNIPSNPIITTGTGTVGATGTITTSPLVSTRYMGNRYAGNRYKGNRRRYLRRGNTRPWNRRRYYYGREGETEADYEEQNMNESDNAENQENLEGVYKGGGVNTKLDIEQLGKSEPHNAAGWIVVDNDDMSKVSKQQQQNKRRRRLKPKTPQTTAIFASTMPTITTMPTTQSNTATTTKASKHPAYVAAAATLTVTEDNVNNNKNNHNNNNNKNNMENNSSQKRKTIWQNLSERWRKYRQRHADVKVENDKDMLVIDETEPMRIKNKRKKNNKNKSKQPQQIKQEQTFNNEENETSLINANNTNSRFHNIMNAFRLSTPTIYLQQR